MEILRFLEQYRTPVLDAFFLLVTRLGEETVFLVLALVLFWCVDKRVGYYLITVGFVGTVFNQLLKILCAVPRPWVRDPDLHPVEGAIAAAQGYSFPSGHTQTITGISGSLSLVYRRRWVIVLLCAATGLVAFSRLYLGVHTPADVLTSLFLGVLLSCVLFPVYRNLYREGRALYGVLAGLCCGSLLLLLAVRLRAGAPVDGILHTDLKNAATLVGCAFGFLIVYIADRGWLRFPTAVRRPYLQLIKAVVGIALLLAVKEGLKPLLNPWLGLYWGSCVRYFLTVLAAGVAWPACFRFFAPKPDHQQEDSGV